MARTKITKEPPIKTVDAPSKIRKIPSSSYLSEYDCKIFAVIYASIPPSNVSKNTTSDAVSIS